MRESWPAMRIFGRFIFQGSRFYGEVSGDEVRFLIQPYWQGLEFSPDRFKGIFVDLVKIFGLRADSFDYGPVVNAIADAGVAVEVSTAGLSKPVRELYPHPEFLAACRARDVPVTLASDAHSPDVVGRDFDQALELLRGAGYETVTVFEHEYASRSNAVVTLGFDGAPQGEPLVASGVDPQPTTFLQVGGGWVAWDAYREEGRYRIAWSLAGASRSSEVPLGRGITAVGADPGGSYVAVSTTTALNIGRIADSVYVLATKDGAEVFRRYLPTYSRSGVAFLGSERFAYDDRDADRFGVRVLRLPTAD